MAKIPKRQREVLDVAITEAADAVEGVTVFHAGTTHRDGDVVTNGGRVLTVTAIGADLNEGTPALVELVSDQADQQAERDARRARRGRP